MRTIERSSLFKRDYKREAKGRYRSILDAELMTIFTLLIADHVLDTKYRDHELIGTWLGYRECHIKPDLLLIYQKLDSDSLKLARLGSHSELFG